MSGISGIVYRNRGRLVTAEQIERMNKVLCHRGPDYKGVWTKANVGLGHTWLSIVNRSPLGRQPASNEDGTAWITFDGEIYNFLELRDRLIEKGHLFRSNTDAETILHLWEEEGERCVERLCGVFAFALWDDKTQTLFLARDREGEKPLFYAPLKDRTIFASEIKAILSDHDFQREPDLEAIHHYLAYQSLPAPRSAFSGIRKLLPAHTLTIKNGQIKLRRYWKLSYRNKMVLDRSDSVAALQSEIIARLRECVRIRLMSDQPPGAFLSGGIDSSIIVALMAGLMDQSVKTFSIGFASEEYNELPYARMVSERYGTEHHEFVIASDTGTILPELVWHYNEPFADSSAIPTYYVCKLAKQHVSVVLCGDAGDENFAGYARYQNRGEYALTKDFPSILSRLVSPNEMLRPFIGGGGWRNRFRRALELDQKMLFYYLRITHFHENYQAKLYTTEFRRHLGNTGTLDLMLDKFRQTDAQNFLDAMLDVDLNFYLPDTLTTKMDIAAMANSLVVRAPMLDYRFLEFTAQIPPEFKLKDGIISKYILKKAVEPYVPKEIIHRKKMGFGVPIDHWFRHELKEMAYDTLLSRRAIERGYFHREYIANMLDRHQKGETWQYLIWNLLMLELWHLMFIDKTFAPPGGIHVI